MKWEIHKIGNLLIDGRIIYAHRHAKSLLVPFQNDFTTINRMSQMNRMISRMRRGEIIDAYNETKSMFDYITRVLLDGKNE